MNQHSILGFLQGWAKAAADKLYLKLAYGENPHQQAVFIENPALRNLPWLSLKNGAVGYNNLLDAEAINRVFDAMGVRSQPAAVVVKHAGPCGVAVADTLVQAYTLAYACDSRSAYGGVVGVNRALDAATAHEIVKHYTVAVVCPSIDDEAADILAAKPEIRLLPGAIIPPLAFDVRVAAGGLLLQQTDGGRVAISPAHSLTSRLASKRELADMQFAMAVVRSCYSNAVVVAKDGMTLGIGAGQPNRIDALWLALVRAKREGHDAHGAVLASDGFFFPDMVEMANQAGITAMAQPGGSKRDRAVAEAAEAANMSLLMTKVRHFKH